MTMEGNRMPNIGVLLKQEIARVARKQIRTEIEPLRAAASEYRKTIATLKARVATLERDLNAVRRATPTKVSTSAEVEPTVAAARFSAKGLKAQRARLGISAGALARLMGVTTQSIYNWENEVSRPRASQLERLVALRKVGKKDVARLLESLEDTPKAA